MKVGLNPTRPTVSLMHPTPRTPRFGASGSVHSDTAGRHSLNPVNVIVLGLPHSIDFEARKGTPRGALPHIERALQFVREQIRAAEAKNPDSPETHTLRLRELQIVCNDTLVRIFAPQREDIPLLQKNVETMETLQAQINPDRLSSGDQTILTKTVIPRANRLNAQAKIVTQLL